MSIKDYFKPVKSPDVTPPPPVTPTPAVYLETLVNLRKFDVK